MSDGREDGWIILLEKERTDDVESAKEDEEQSGFEVGCFEEGTEVMSDE